MLVSAERKMTTFISRIMAMFLPKLKVKSAVIASPYSTGTDSLERKMNISLRPSNPYLLCFRLCTGGSENPDPFSPNENKSAVRIEIWNSHKNCHNRVPLGVNSNLVDLTSPN